MDLFSGFYPALDSISSAAFSVQAFILYAVAILFFLFTQFLFFGQFVGLAWVIYKCRELYFSITKPQTVTVY